MLNHTWHSEFVVLASLRVFATDVSPTATLYPPLSSFFLTIVSATLEYVSFVTLSIKQENFQANACSGINLHISLHEATPQ